jgi:hypothetical protein
MTEKKKDHDEKSHEKESHGKGHEKHEEKEHHGKGHFAPHPDQTLPGDLSRERSTETSEALKRAQEDLADQSNRAALEKNPNLDPSMFPSPTPYGSNMETQEETKKREDLEKAEKGELKAELQMSSGRSENEGELEAGRKAGDVIKSLYIPDGQVLEVFDFRAEMTVAGSDEKAGLELRVRGKSYSSRANEPDAEPTTLITGNTLGVKSAAIPLPPQRIAPVGDRGGIVDIIQVRDDTTGVGTVTLDGGLVSEEEAAAPKTGEKASEEETKESKKKDSDKGEE